MQSSSMLLILYKKTEFSCKTSYIPNLGHIMLFKLRNTGYKRKGNSDLKNKNYYKELYDICLHFSSSKH